MTATDDWWDDPVRRGAAVAAAVAVVAGAIVFAVSGGGADAVTSTTDTTSAPQIVVGEVEPPVGGLPDGPGVMTDPSGSRLSPTPEPAYEPGILPPDGRPPGPPIPFASTSDPYAELVFVLVAGSDARPGEDVTRTRADSLHVIAINPALGRGTIVGIPRDSWVDIPGHGKGKINSALVLGGPQLLAQTVGQLTGMPLRYYVVTGFAGFVSLTDELGGVNVYVERRMNDRNSGARFEPGWHFFHGDEALAYARNRKDVALGDFSRSEHHGVLMLATLAKMRAEVGNDDGIRAWLSALQRHVQLDVGFGDLTRLAVLARITDPRSVANVVASGGVGRAGGQSVVFLDDAARAMFADVADDGVLRNPPPPYEPPGTNTTTTTTTTTTTAPTTTAPPTTTPPRPTTTSTSVPSTTTTLVGVGNP